MSTVEWIVADEEQAMPLLSSDFMVQVLSLICLCFFVGAGSATLVGSQEDRRR